MTFELRPLGVKCNIRCSYCYQEPIREAARIRSTYDLAKITDAVVRNNERFILFGGEPLLLPKRDLEDLFALGYARFGGSGIQTNGVLLDSDHIAMFKKYCVNVGLSIDGPGQLNSLRWAGSAAKTEAATRRSLRSMEELLEAGIVPGIIITLHKANAASSALPRLLDWFSSLDMMGLSYARLHLLEVDSPAIGAAYALSDEENVTALGAIRNLEKTLCRLRFDLFQEVRALLSANDRNVSCTWRSCDPYTTPAVHGVEGMGQSSNCGRTNKAGVDYLKSDATGHERYLSLYYTPFEFGGCKGCRFFLFCRGQCPGEAIDGDWRNRSANCRVWFELFAMIEGEMIREELSPVSQRLDLLELESRMLSLLEQGTVPSIARLVEERSDRGHP